MLTREFDYIVRPGDTLFGIALKFNVPFDTLKNLNHLPDPDRIQPGQVIQVPVSEEFYQIVRLVEEQCGLAQPSDAAAEATAAAVETAAQRLRRAAARLFFTGATGSAGEIRYIFWQRNTALPPEIF